MSNEGSSGHLVITVHGIRTYGRWQKRLGDALGQDSRWNVIGGEDELMHYRYGIFTLFSFLVPFVRNLAVRQFRAYLEAAAGSRNWSRVDIVAHSFGAYLVVETLRYADLSPQVRVNTVILCGAAISPNTILANVVGVGKPVGRLINECGTRDGILLLTLLVYGVGMAGRIGLQGLEGQRFCNRFHGVGHSGYFELNSGAPYGGFISRWWIPVLLGSGAVRQRDRRPDRPTFLDRMWSVLGENGSTLTVSVYAAILALIAGTFFYLWLQADAARKTALISQSRFLADLSSQSRTAGNGSRAMNLALEALPQKGQQGRPVVREAIVALENALRSNRERQILKHAKPVIRAAFGPDSQSVVTVTSDELSLWDVPSGKIIAKLNGHTLIDENSIAFIFLPDHKLLSYTGDETLRIWDLRSGKLLQTIWVGKNFHPNVVHDHTLVGTRDDSFVERWNLKTGEKTDSFELLYPVVSPDGTRVAGRESDESVSIIELDSQRAIVLREERSYSSSEMFFSADGNYLVTGGEVWNVATGAKFSPAFNYEGVRTSVALSPENSRIIISTNRGFAYLWDTRNRRQIAVFRGTETLTGQHQVSFSPVGERLVTLFASDRFATIWDRETGERIATLAGHEKAINGVGFSSDGRLVLTFSDDGTARIWSVDQDDLVSVPLNELILDFDFDDAGGAYAISSEKGKAVVWRNGIKQFVLSEGPTKLTGALINPTQERIVTVSSSEPPQLWNTLPSPLTVLGRTSPKAFFSYTGRYVITYGNENGISVWSAQNGGLVSHIPGNASRLAIDLQDEKLFAIFEEVGKATIWSLRSGEKISELADIADSRVARFSTSGTQILTTSEDQRALISRDVRDGGIAFELVRHDDIIYDANFSRDDTRIVSASRDGSARIWDVKTRRQIGRAMFHREPVRVAQFSQDGRFVLTVSGARAYIWNAENNELLSDLEEHRFATGTAIFNRKADRVISVSQTEVRLSKIFLDAEDLVDFAKSKLARCLSSAERRRYYLNEEEPAWCSKFEGK
ncbi:hypothetical protein [Bradyrhizobium sp. WU425]|uniref:hypothetical protein n=1 Tax=Bradyrhizobium sp. WU425 TaxID=187029 RepID=UPI001E386158|nr:hypothetical protein [Bradyrhizobium canariense]UFW69196.1 hypothetical protein BcanWU425_20735 [Bradyrhizobium canariense]